MPMPAFPRRRLSLAAALLLLPLNAALAQDQAAEDLRQYQDWAVRCGPVDEGKPVERCLMTQFAGKDNKPMAQATFAYEPKEGRIVGQFTTPLGSVLPTGLRLKVDEGKEGRAPFQFCIPVGCRVVFPVKPEFIASMKRGNVLHMAFDLINGQTAKAGISLQGFSAALNAITPEAASQNASD